jgi:hypothetical protein
MVILTPGKQRQNEQKQPSAEVDPLPRRAGAQQLAKDQAQIESSDMNELPLEDVVVLTQMSAPHASSVVAVREAAFYELAAPSE